MRADRTVIVIGAFLSLIGLLVAWNGYSYILVERGPPMVVGGTIAFCSGLLLVALGFILRELGQISSSASKATLLLAKRGVAAPEEVPAAPYQLPPLEALEEAPVPAAESQPGQPPLDQPPLDQTPLEQAPFDEAAFEAQSAEAPPEPTAPATRRFRLPRVDDIAEGTDDAKPSPLSWMIRPEKAEPASSAKGENWVKSGFSRFAAPREPLEKEPVQDPVREPVGEFADEHLAEPETSAEEIAHAVALPLDEPAPVAEWRIEDAALAAESALDLETLQGSHDPAPHHQEPELAPEPAPEPAPGAEPSHPHEPEAAPSATEPAPASEVRPEVIGHYEAHGAHYIMYADGSIDAQTAHGVYRFGSMEELKSFIQGQS